LLILLARKFRKLLLIKSGERDKPTN